MNRHIRFLIPVFFVGLITLITGCGRETITGKGTAKQENRDIAKFSGINVNGDYSILGKIGSPQALVIRSNPNILPYINSSVEKDILMIEDDKSVDLRPSTAQNIWFTTQHLNSLELSGSSQFHMTDLNEEDLKISLAGSQKLFLTGKATRLNVVIKGSSHVNAKNVAVDDARIEINGSGIVEVTVAKNLDVTINGDGKVMYYGGGQPKVTQTIHGAGKVSSAFGALDSQVN